LLHNDKGMAADDIAARFGVTPAVVRQRLKLGAVSPVLMALYREDGITLEQLMAFTITDDHARQEEVWNGLGYPRHRRGS
jgi:ParB family chromosome partitioning protein